MSTIDTSKKYRTRSGEPVRILCTDSPNSTYPVIGYIEGRGDITECIDWMASGQFDVAITRPHPTDLIEISELREWVVAVGIRGDREVIYSTDQITLNSSVVIRVREVTEEPAP